MFMAYKMHEENKAQRKILKYLIAESDPDLRYLYSEYLNAIGLEVTVVENGYECLENLTDHKDQLGYEIVMLDSHLTDMSGFDLAKQIREIIPDQRILFTTTYSFTQIGNNLDLLKIDHDDVLLKPFGFEKLLSKIKRNARLFE